MPQIVVEYSVELGQALDRRAFAAEFHAEASTILDMDIDAFKTRFYPIEDAVIGDGTPSNVMVSVSVGMLSGREERIKHEVGAAAMDLLARHFTPPSGVSVQLTVEVYDLDRGNYHKRVIG